MMNSPYSRATFMHSSMHFFIGKVVSALLSLGILFWLVHLLPVTEYGVYMILQAGMGLALAITSLGIPWVAARYLPEFRLYANGVQLKIFVFQIIVLASLFVIGGAVFLYITMPWLLGFMKVTQQLDVARLYLLVLILEGFRTNIQVSILEPLLQQGQAQLNQVIRSLTILLCLGVIEVVQGTIHLHHVVLAELAGSFLGAALGFHGLFRYLHGHQTLQGNMSWKPPVWLDMWRTARHMYFSYLVNVTYSSPVFVFLTQRFLGVEVTAQFGFLLNLHDQICRYLPATLLSSLIRPKLIVSFKGAGGMGQLTINANLVGKLSLFILMPILVYSWLAGGELISQLSGGKFTQAGYYLAGLLLMLVPYSQRQILETVAVASGQSNLCLWGTTFGALCLPLAYWFLDLGLGLWSPILGMIVSQIIFNTTITAAMMINTTYLPDSTGIFKLIVAALLSFALSILVKISWMSLLQLHETGWVGMLESIQDIVYILFMQQILPPIEGWLDLCVTAMITCVLFLLVSYFLKPFRTEERARLNSLNKWNVFVW